MDERAFLVLDHVLLGGLIGHGPQHLVGHVGTGLHAFARQEGVRDADEAPGDPAERRERQEQADDRGRDEGGALGVLHGPGLGRQLRHHEDHNDLEHRRDDDPEPAEGVRGDDPDEGGRHQRAQLECEQHDGEDPVDALARGAAGLARRVASPRPGRAFTLEVRVMAVSDMARKPVATISSTTTTTRMRSVPPKWCASTATRAAHHVRLEPSAGR